MYKASLAKYRLIGKLPDPFLAEDGSRVTSPADWDGHRKQLKRLAVDFQYGGMPPQPQFVNVEPLYEGARLSSYRISTGTKERPISFCMQIVFPPEKKAVYPAVIDGDACFDYMYKDAFLQPFQDIGAIFVRFDRTELAADVRKQHSEGLYAVYPGLRFTGLAAWAWGYHRCVDALEQLGIADKRFIVFTGHSRGAKTALLAGATDERAAIVNPNAGCSGAGACYRVHSSMLCEDGVVRPSSTLEKMALFPDWFTPELLSYAGREEELPLDCHFLKALVAPRMLLVTEAMSDAWANPAGVSVTNRAAGEVFRFLGAEDKLLLHYRDGFHAHAPEDARILANVIAHAAWGQALDPSIGQDPFAELPRAYDWTCP